MSATNTPIPFTYESNAVRVIDRDGEPWFVAADVCAVLQVKNTSDAIRRLDDDEVTLDQIEGSHRQINLINESGLYSLILRSDKPEAKPFRKWVTSQVLPTIRKTGGYGTPNVPANFADALQLAADQARQIADMQPKAEQYDSFISADGMVCLRDAMRTVNAMPIKGIEALKAKGVLCYEGGALTPKVYYLQQGYFAVKQRIVDGETRKQTMGTPKGMAWLAQTLPDTVFRKGAA